MPVHRYPPVARRSTNDPRTGVSVSLPVYGVGLGPVSESHVTVLINNRMLFGKADRIAGLPVSLQPRQRYVRPGKPDDLSELKKADVEEILRWDLQPRSQPSLEPQHSSVVRQDRYPQNVDRSLRPPTQTITQAPRALWQSAGAEGVLFLLIFGKVGEDTYEAIARDINTLLCSQDVSRCVIPARSVKPPIAQSGPPPALCFALASCQYTSGMVDATPPGDGFMQPAAGPADKSYQRLVSYLRPEQEAWRPELLLLAGDQVYVDATAGFFDPTSVDGRFVRPYEQLYGSIYVQHITRQLPVCMMLDDHELRDNWEQESDATEDLTLGRKAYVDFQRLGGLVDPGTSNKLWAELSFQGYDFFLTDTRTERERRTAAELDHVIMSGPQLGHLEAWLGRPNPDNRPRFVLSPSMLIPRRLSTVGSDPSGDAEPLAAVLQSDAWDGYPSSFNALFEILAATRARNVIFLSGDEHRCCRASATQLGPGGVTIHSIHSSGLYTPYVFANASPEDFVPEETLALGASQWRVQSEFAPPGQGFALIRVTPQTESWTVEIRFSLHSGRSTDVSNRDHTLHLPRRFDQP